MCLLDAMWGNVSFILCLNKYIKLVQDQNMQKPVFKKKKKLFPCEGTRFFSPFFLFLIKHLCA